MTELHRELPFRDISKVLAHSCSMNVACSWKFRIRSMLGWEKHPCQEPGFSRMPQNTNMVRVHAFIYISGVVPKRLPTNAYLE